MKYLTDYYLSNFLFNKNSVLNINNIIIYFDRSVYNDPFCLVFDIETLKM